MNKQSDIFYEAQSATMEGKLENTNYCKLLKYREALISARGVTGEPADTQTYLFGTWLSDVEKEIDNRKRTYKKRLSYFVVSVLIGVVILALASLLSIPLPHLFQRPNIDNSQTKKQYMQPRQDEPPTPTSPSREKMPGPSEKI